MLLLVYEKLALVETLKCSPRFSRPTVPNDFGISILLFSVLTVTVERLLLFRDLFEVP